MRIYLGWFVRILVYDGQICACSLRYITEFEFVHKPITNSILFVIKKDGNCDNASNTA